MGGLWPSVVERWRAVVGGVNSRWRLAPIPCFGENVSWVC